MSKTKNTRVCARCGGVNDSKTVVYCKRCSVIYQRERRRINAGTQCAAPRCKGKRTASSAYCKACNVKRERKYKRERLAKMTPKELAAFRKKRAEHNRKHTAKLTPKERAERNRKERAKLAKLTPKERQKKKERPRLKHGHGSPP